MGATHRLAAYLLVACGAFFAASPDVRAQDEAWPKTINLYIGSGPGGGYDYYGRLAARHLGRHLPGAPTITPQNMPGAGSITAANYVYRSRQRMVRRSAS